MLARAAPPSFVTLIFAVKQTGVPAGAALAGALVPLLILAFGWRWSAIAIGLACGSVALAAQTVRERFDVDLNTAARLSFARVVAPLALVVKHKGLANLALSALVYGSVQMALVTYLVTFVIDTFAVSLVVAGFVLSCSQIGAVVGRLFWATVSDRSGSRRPILGLLGVAMGVLACATFIATPAWPRWLLFLFAAAFGATALGWNGVYLAEVAHRAPADKVSEATGACMFLSFFGAVVSPLLFYLLLSLTGTYWVPYAVVGTLAIITGGRMLLKKTD
jgi:MFS family permease